MYITEVLVSTVALLLKVNLATVYPISLESCPPPWLASMYTTPPNEYSGTGVGLGVLVSGTAVAVKVGGTCVGVKVGVGVNVGVGVSVGSTGVGPAVGVGVGVGVKVGVGVGEFVGTSVGTGTIPKFCVVFAETGTVTGFAVLAVYPAGIVNVST